MRTQRARQPKVVYGVSLAPAGAASSTELVLAGVLALLVVAAVVAYAVPALRRRRSAKAGLEGEAEPAAHVTASGAEWGIQLADDVPEPPDLAPATGAPVTHPGRQLAVGYTTFPERRRAVSPESRYQARRISAACEARGIVLHKLVGDVQSYSGPDLERPGLTHALDLLNAGEASCLVVAGLDRLSRSAANLGTVIDWLEDLGARLVVIDIDLDTHSDDGRLAARALVRVGTLERKGSQHPEPGSPRSGGSGHGSMGRPAVSDRPLLQRRIATMRASGMTLQGIADTLNAEGVPTLRGGTEWRPSSVQAATGYKRPGRNAEHDAAARHDEEEAG